MGSIVVLGGAGGVGRVAVKALDLLDEVAHVIVADLDQGAGAGVASAIGGDKLEPAAVDVDDPDALASLLARADVVLNCVGPFYRFGPPVLEAALRAGVGYVDICDDLDATRALLALDGAARDAGVTALIGMGNSPGLANIFVKLCADELLDEVISADICHIHGGEPAEGAGVLKHRIHAMVNDVPLFLDGEFTSVRQLEASGAEHVREIDFAGVGRYPAYPYPHPETITLPAVFPSLRRATNLGVVYPLSYFTMTQDLVRAGMALEDPIPVGGTRIAPMDVMVALLQHERPRLMQEAGVDTPGGCLLVEVSGDRDGAQHTYEFSLTSTGAGAGEGTGIPAALGAALHLRGSLGDDPGVHPPEAIVPVHELLELAGAVIGDMGFGDGGGSGIPLRVDHIGPDGSRESIPLALGAELREGDRG